MNDSQGSWPPAGPSDGSPWNDDVHDNDHDNDHDDNDNDNDHNDNDHEAVEARYGQRRLALAGLVTVFVLLVVIVATRGGDDTEPGRQGPLRIDAWAPYWAFDRSIPDLDAHGDLLAEVSPFVYIATGATEITLDPSADVAAVDAFDTAAREAGLAIVPSILDRMPAGGMAEVLADPSTRQDHVAEIVALADEIDADGIDIDYEQFAFADDRSTWSDTRPAFSAFIDELAVALRADGRTVTVSVPPVYDGGTTPDSGYWVYDYAALAASADRIRIMAYDYSGQAAGPVSPLSWVRETIAGAIEAAGGPDKLVLGIPLYGNNVPIDTTGTCPDGEEIGRTAVTIRSVDELIERRGATPVADEVTGEWTFTYELTIGEGDDSCTQLRQVNYVDSDGAVARIALAEEAGLAGVSLWALGYEDDTFWDLLTAAPAS